MTDAQLLSDYTSTASPAALEQLVQRHINLVYSIALRSTRDCHQAEDVTQAVFLVLARKARSITNPAYLPAWLMSTTRYTATNARRRESRRERHERQAAAMNSEVQVASPLPDTNLSPLLDRGLSTLSDIDRTAIILRYLHGKSTREIAFNLAIAEPTAQKRITRALEKIRVFLARHGIVRPADAIEFSLSRQYLHAAPAGLSAVIISHSTSAATTSASLLANTTIKTIAWAQAKILIAGCAACLAVVTSAAVIVKSPVTARANTTTSPAATESTQASASIIPASSLDATTGSQPALPDFLLLPNDSFVSSNNTNGFTYDIDADTTRDSGPPTLHLTGTGAPTVTGGTGRRVDIVPFLGKRVRFSAFVKSAKLTNWGGLILTINDKTEKVIALDDMAGRGTTQSSSWTQLQIVVDVPPQSNSIFVGLHMHGSGELWLDGARIEVVSRDVPTTDDHNMHLYSAIAAQYSVRTDPDVQRNGHPVKCVSSQQKPTGSWCWYGVNTRDPAPFLGHRIRVSAWIKSEKVTGTARLSVWAWTPEGKLICIDNPATRKIIKGTTEWTHYETTADVPAQLQHLDPGLNLFGNGKIWVDDYRVELLPDEGSL